MSAYVQPYLWETTNTSSPWPTLTGDVDDSNKRFRTSTGWKAASIPIVFLNGKHQIQGVDYEIAWQLAGAIDMTIAPSSGTDEVVIGFIPIA